MNNNLGSQKCVADELEINSSTLSTIVKNRMEIEECYETARKKSPLQRKYVKTGMKQATFKEAASSLDIRHLMSYSLDDILFTSLEKS